MITITAQLRARRGHEATMRQALADVAAHAAASEPATIGFFVSQNQDDPTPFTTDERFLDTAAMDTHDGSEALACCSVTIRPILDGDVVLVTGEDVSARPA